MSGIPTFSFMRRAISTLLLAGGCAALASTAGFGTTATSRTWMTEEAMREAFSGQTLDGHYGSGTAWTETYTADGRIDYREGARAAQGRWSFRNATFCTFYDPAFTPAFVGGCWQVLRTGANCYEFYTAGFRWPGRRDEDGDGADDEQEGGDSSPNARIRWNARGWRTSEPSTCPEKPSV